MQNLGKLSDPQVQEMRERYAAGGVLQRELAAAAGVDIVTAHQAITGKTYRGAGGPISPIVHRRPHKLTAELVQEIRQARAAGLSLRVLAARAGVSVALISRISRGEVWREPSALITLGAGPPKRPRADAADPRTAWMDTP